MNIQISIDTEIVSYADFKSLLDKELVNHQEKIMLEISKQKIRIRGVDPTVLVASVSALGIGLGALIAGIFNIAKEIVAKKIIIQTKDGAKLEFNSNTKPKEIDMLIEKLKKMGGENKIFIS